MGWWDMLFVGKGDVCLILLPAGLGPSLGFTDQACPCGDLEPQHTTHTRWETVTWGSPSTSRFPL